MISKRYCCECGQIYETNLNSNSIRCPTCTKAHDLTVRRERKRIRDKYARLKQGFNERFTKADITIIYDPAHLFRPGAVFSEKDFFSDLKYGSYTPGTVITNKQKGKAYIVDDRDQPKNEEVQEALECIVFQLRLAKITIIRRKVQIHPISTPIRIVIIYESGYNMLNISRVLENKCPSLHSTEKT